jgi:peptide/nickel transport system substrate-binding protein
MLNRSTRLRGLVAFAAVSVMALSACGTSGGSEEKGPESSPGFAECEQKPNDCNTGPVKDGGSITIMAEKSIQDWNTISADGNTLDTSMITNGVYPIPFYSKPNGEIGWNQDLLVEEPKLLKTDPQTWQYKIKPEAVWSDGTPISVKDFQYHWRAANGVDCPECDPASDTGYKSIEKIEGTDNDKTVTVTLKAGELYSDWQSLFVLFPSHIAAQQGDLSTPAGLKKAFDYFRGTPTWSGGPFLIEKYDTDVSVVMVRNPKWYGKKAPLEKITFRIITDQAQHIPALRNQEVQMLTSQPNDDLVKQVSGLPGVNYNISAGQTWEHFDLNTTNKYLADKELRRAIFTATNRQEIIDKTVGVFFKKAAPLNNHNLMPGNEGYKDYITPTGQGAGKVDDAKKILTDAGYKIEGGKLIGKDGAPVPPFRFKYTTGNTLRQQSGELWQAQLKQIGIDISIEPITSLGGTLNSGDFDMIIYAWVGSQFIGDNVALWRTGGGSNFGKYSNPEVDKLLDAAARELDKTKQRDLFNQAGELMAKDAYVLPIFQKPAFIAVYSQFLNVRNNPNNSSATYNVQEWGEKAA